MPTVYAYAGCSTCRKATKWLAEHDIAAETHDLKTHPPDAATLAAAIERSGLPLKRFFNTSGQSYRGGGWKDRVGALSVDEAAAALAADGMLIKRPLVLADDGGVLVGFKPDAWEAALVR